jgi:hypothetical protein
VDVEDKEEEEEEEEDLSMNHQLINKKTHKEG